tara:strand:- start:674 stop:1483 length:810 start_codon:yes stop_codon:yes gene_type:complete
MRTSDSFFALAARARATDIDRYLCALFAPRPARSALFALILFNGEIARVREMVSEPMLGQIRLQWWRETIEKIYTGQTRRHEVAEPLIEAIRTHDLTRGYFDRLIDAREQDLNDAPPKTLAALETYAEESAAPLVSLALESVGVDASEFSDLARHSGIAWALTGQIRAVPHLSIQGRSMLPRNTMCEGGDMAAVITEILDTSRYHVDRARQLRKGLPIAAKRATLQVVLADAYLRRLAANGCDPYHMRAGIGPLHRQLLLIRAAFLGLA